MDTTGQFPFLYKVQKSNDMISRSSCLYDISDSEVDNMRLHFDNVYYRWVSLSRSIVSMSSNRGIASKTLKHIENELGSSGVEAIRLDVFTNNPNALSLYYNNGYQKVGIAKWRKGEFALMEKHLKNHICRGETEQGFIEKSREIGSFLFTKNQGARCSVDIGFAQMQSAGDTCPEPTG